VRRRLGGDISGEHVVGTGLGARRQEGEGKGKGDYGGGKGARKRQNIAHTQGTKHAWTESGSQEGKKKTIKKEEGYPKK